MTDVWDIAQYVEAHPDNHAQRWRLAKKLYMAWEYRLALEHLQILDNEWDSKLSVVRYLAATYYRLSRYDEAIRELERGIENWPEELGLLEQLARTLDVAGRSDDAVKVWETIAGRDPDHPFAKRAVMHLRSQLGRGRDGPSVARPVPAIEEEPAAGESPCPTCGAMNSPEFKRCWQCHAPLEEATSFVDVSTSSGVTRESGVPWGTITGLAIAGLLAVGGYLTYQGYVAAEAAQPGTDVPTVFFDFITGTLFWTRVIAGCVLLVVWPILWRVSAGFMGITNVFDETLYSIGALLAALTYAVTWVPGSLTILIVLVPAAVSAAISFGALRIPPKTALGLWIVQGAAALIVVSTLLVARHGVALLTEFPTMLDFASAEVNATEVYKAKTPFAVDLNWKPSGSAWLDEHATTAGFVIETGIRSKSMIVHLHDGGTTLVHDELKSNTMAFDRTSIVQGKTYQLEVIGEEGVDVTLTVRGLHDLSLRVRE